MKEGKELLGCADWAKVESGQHTTWGPHNVAPHFFGGGVVSAPFH